MIVLLSQKLNKKLWFSLVFIILVFILFTFYFFAYGPATPLSPDGPQVSHGQDQSEDGKPLPEMLKHGLEMVREMVAMTDHYGVVDEDAMSERVKQLICEDKALRNAYMKYRQKAWDLRQGARAEDSAGLFDNPGYLPSLSPLVQGALAKDSHSESEHEE